MAWAVLGISAGNTKAKRRISWGCNAMRVNWQNDALVQFTDISAFASTGISMAYDNPNYNLQMLAALLIARWWRGKTQNPWSLLGPTWSWPQVCAVAFLVTGHRNSNRV